MHAGVNRLPDQVSEIEGARQEVLVLDPTHLRHGCLCQAVWEKHVEVTKQMMNAECTISLLHHKLQYMSQLPVCAA